MQGFLKNILRMAMAVFAVCTVTSCVYDDMQDESEIPDNRTLLNIGFNFPMSLAESGERNGYLPGVGYENYIDIKNKGYRIYFFDNADKYVTRFIPIMVAASGDGEDNAYEVLGEVPDEISGLTDFKIVVLANWPSYPDDSLEPGVTSIDGLCNAASAQFSCLTSFDLNPDKGLTIPFFGIHHYKGVTIKKGKLTTLEEPIALLRSMAKVEVIVDIDGVSLSSIGLRGYNSKGFCAPGGVYSQTDYDHGGIWNDDYVKTPHLVGGANDAGQENTFLPLFRQYESNGAQKETWIAYVPEYRNLDSDGTENYKSHLELELDIQNDSTPYDIYFADYDANGKMVKNSYFDILRNNCYRFTISIHHGAFIIKVKKWQNAYDNKFTFD